MSSQYSAPKILNDLRPYLDIPRFQYSDNFPEFVNVESEEHVEYREGLIAIGGCIGLFFFLWASILLILRCAGKTAGCAAGYGFDQTFDEKSTSQSNNNRGANSGERNSFSVDTETGNRVDSNGYDKNAYLLQRTRERRIKSCFLLFSIMVVFCIPPIIILVIEPLKRTSDTGASQVLEANGLLGELSSSLSIISSSTTASRSIAQRTPIDFTSICPSEVFEYSNNTALALSEEEQDDLESAKIGLLAMHKLILNGIKNTYSLGSSEMQDMNKFYSKLIKVFRYFESTQEEVKTYVWVLPLILLGTVISTLALMIGVSCSGKLKASASFRAALSYIVLPLILVSAVVAVLVAVVTAISVVVTDDACNGGSQQGTPHQTIMAILSAFDIQQSETIYTFTSALSGECEAGVDPTESLQGVENNVQNSIDAIWTTLAEIDKVETRILVAGCEGQDTTIEKFLSDSRTLARFLTNARRALASTAESLSCDRVYPLYVESVEGTMCTEIPESIAWAFIFFFLLALSTMAMITLRAAWQHSAEEEEDIYGEDEEIENMFVDEHEEYLAYISKYKHEWEDYEGMNPDKPKKPQHGIYPTGFGASRTHSDTDSGEGRISNGELFEDEHFLNVRTYGYGGNPDFDYEGPSPSAPFQNESYSPVTIESEITFMSMRESAMRTGEVPPVDDTWDDKPLFPTDSCDPMDVGQEGFVRQLSMVIEEQGSRENDFVHRLSRDIKWQEKREIREMKQFAAPPSHGKTKMGKTKQKSEKSASVKGFSTKSSSPTAMHVLPTNSTESSEGSTEAGESSGDEGDYCDEPYEEQPADDNDIMNPASPDIERTSEPIAGSQRDFGLSNHHFFDDEVPSSPGAATHSRFIAHFDEGKEMAAADPDNFFSNSNGEWVGFENSEGAGMDTNDDFLNENDAPFSKSSYPQDLVVVSTREEFFEESPKPVESFGGPPEPVESFDEGAPAMLMGETSTLRQASHSISPSSSEGSFPPPFN